MFFIFSVCVRIKSQYIYNSCDKFISYGDSVVTKTYICDTNAIEHGNDGANITWNYSMLSFADSSTGVTKYLDPNITPYKNLFPEANLSTLTSNNVYSYFKHTADSSLYLGQYISETNYEYPVWDPQCIIKCPFSFGNSFYDVYHRNRQGSNVYSHTYTARTATYDAYGTLILPTGTFNTYRTKWVQTTIDSVFSSYVGFIMATQTTDTIYTWYDIDNNTLPVMMWMKSRNSSLNVTSKLVFFYKYPSLITQIKNAVSDNKIQLWYSNNLLTILSPNNSDNYYLEIYDVLGKNILSCQINDSYEIVNIQHIKSGVYFYKIMDANNLMFKGSFFK